MKEFIIKSIPDIISPVYGKLSDMDDVLILIHFFRLGLNKISLKRIKDQPMEIKEGAIYCFIEDIGNIKRWTDNFKWSYSKISRPFLDYHQIEGDLIKRTITVRFGDFSYHLINYFSKGTTKLQKFSEVDFMINLQRIVEKNKALLCDDFLTESAVGIKYIYLEKGALIYSLKDEQHVANFFMNYGKTLKKFLFRYGINKFKKNEVQLTSAEKDAVNILLKLSQTK